MAIRSTDDAPAVKDPCPGRDARSSVARRTVWTGFF
jgi:hypothetical protein